MRYLLDHKRRIFAVVADVGLTAAAYLLSHLIRFEGDIPRGYLELFGHTVPILIMVRAACSVWFGLYRGMWAYASLSDLLAILKAVSAGSVLFVVTLTLFGIRGFSRGVLILDWLLVIFLVGGARLSLRLWRTARVPKRHKDNPPVLVIGAGDAGEAVIRELQMSAKLKMRPVGLLDDDPGKKGLRIHGVPVLGTIAEVKEIAEEKRVDEVVIAIPSADRRTMRGIFEHCQRAGVKVKVLPGLGALLAGTAKVSEIREIRLEDLLPRDPARLDVNLTRAFFAGKRVLVTGAGGSIGSEVCRQVAVCDPAVLVLVERGENALFEIDVELGAVFPALHKVPVIADIKHVSKLDGIFGEFRPEIVLNAAAFKHVPLMELHPEEAVLNNIVGTRRLAETAIRHGVRLFLQISTDKAVNPTSVMGATKRAVERFLQSLASDSAQRTAHSAQEAEVRGQQSDSGQKSVVSSQGTAGSGGAEPQSRRATEPQRAEGSSQRSEPTTDHRPPTSDSLSTASQFEIRNSKFEISPTIFCAVRFGNVLGSSGSVVPTFRRQIERGGPVTVTHPDITRYFMTIPEAVQLVLRAATLAQGGEIFVLDMGIPVKIADMARDLIRLSGLEPDRDIEIAFTGLRPGEKLTEELWYADEQVTPTVQDKLLVVRSQRSEVSEEADVRGQRSEPQSLRAAGERGGGGQGSGARGQGDELTTDHRPLTTGTTPHALLLRDLEELEHVALAGDRSDVLAALRRVVPEYGVETRGQRSEDRGR